MPIVAGMGGNAATQTLTVIVRGIALGELTWGNSRKALLKEGAGRPRQRRRRWASIAAVVAWVDERRSVLGIILGWRWSSTCSWRRSAGTLIPLGLKALKIDPALASSVFITTFTDVCGFASFLGLATMFTAVLPVRVETAPSGRIRRARRCPCTAPTPSSSEPTSSAKRTGSWCS